mmetsp:Transcript_5729/g.19934  ORF Transcript_5729/g.19934 Transcript_5729/m.19934 type:complete len:210 (-) Transcript_5729:33-662(-)
MYHGATALTRTPSLAHSHASTRTSWFIAALDIAYGAPERIAAGPPATEELNTTQPRPDAARRGLHATVRWKAEVRLVVSTSSSSPASYSCAFLRMFLPTLFTSTSSVPPKAADAAETSSVRWASDATSHREPRTSSPAARHASSEASSSAPSRAHVYTAAPRPASSSTIARPRPFVPPVTSAVRPASDQRAASAPPGPLPPEAMAPSRR